MYDIEKFFDEMNVLKSEKERRIKTAKQIEAAMRDFFDTQMEDVEEGVYLERRRNGDYSDMLIDLYFTFLPEKERYSDEFAGEPGEFAEAIQKTTDKAVLPAEELNDRNNTTENSDNNRGQETRGNTTQSESAQEEQDVAVQGGGLTEAQKKTVFSDSRVRLISLNETLRIWNIIRHKELKSVQSTHTWQSMDDDRVRPTHIEADGQTVPINEPFHVGEYLLMYPGDRSLGAGDEEVMLCRCYEL